MLVADDMNHPYLDVVADAAKEIAELKAKVAKLEKLIDGVMAHHLAGADPLPINSDLEHESSSNQWSTVASVTGDSFDPTLLDDIIAPADPALPEPALNVCCGSATCTNTCGRQNTTAAPDTAELPYEALPSSVLSLIFRPTKAALTSTDDLTLISGLSLTTALELAAHDVSRFQDIANLDASAVTKIRQKIPSAEHINKDGWIEQAAILATGEMTAHARVTLEKRTLDDAAHISKTHTHNEGGKSPLALLDRKTATPKDVDCDMLPEVAAEATLDNLTQRNLPRTIVIERPMKSLMQTPENATSFLPMAAVDAGFAVTKIPHHAPTAPRDYGNARALAASLVATVVVVVASSMVSDTNFGLNPSELLHADVCKMTGLTTLAETCKQVLATVL